MTENIGRKRYKDEARYPWLSPLLDTYHYLDTAFAQYIREDQRRQNQTIACKKGCCECCKAHSIPINLFEIQGISWYVMEELKGPLRDEIKKQLKIAKERKDCPFLVNGICSIYPMRPIACRTFFVYGKPCFPGEDVIKTRPSDLLGPNKEIGKQSAYIMLPLFGITDYDEQNKAFESGFIADQSRLMHTLDWNAMSVAIEMYDSKTSNP